MEFASPVIRDRLIVDRFIAAHSAFRCGDEEAANERFILLIAGLLHDAPPKPNRIPCFPEIRERIDDAPTAHHTLEDLAEEAGLSRFQLFCGFAKYTGLTQQGYVMQRRLDIARSMIRHGADLADAAFGAGFADQSDFHRSFTRRYGLTPGAYAAAMR